MAKYKINEEGLEQLSRVVEILNSKVEEIQSEGEKLLSVADSNSEIMGPHAGDIFDITNTIDNETKALGDLVGGLIVSVQELIEKYNAIISKRIYVDSDEGGSQPGPKIKTLHR